MSELDFGVIAPVRFVLNGKSLQMRLNPNGPRLKEHDLTQNGTTRIGFSWSNGQGLGLENPTDEQLEALWHYMCSHPETTGSELWKNIKR